jgi:hypothetical protein
LYAFPTDRPNREGPFASRFAFGVGHFEDHKTDVRTAFD